MRTSLCRGLPPDWWTPESGGARFAVMICRRCPGCPIPDPEPAGVIRDGIAYSYNGAVLPLCGCGRPCHGYRGGDPRCRLCAEPNLDLINVRHVRDRWLSRLHDERGMTDREIAAEVGITVRAVGCARRQHRRRQGEASCPAA